MTRNQQTQRRLASRRTFIKAAVALGSSWQILNRGMAAQGATLLNQAPITRKDARDLSDDEADKYREAFRRVKAIGPERPVWQDGGIQVPSQAGLNKIGYSYQALIHTNNCPHRNWWFLPWHRAYLFTFEQVLRAAVADYKPAVSLAVPYWNWTEENSLPRIFTEDPSTNPLYDERRFSFPITDEDVGREVIRNAVDNIDTFPPFGSGRVCSKRAMGAEGPLEHGPHDSVHGSVGGFTDENDPSTFGTMTAPLTSAFDPIFWSHHSNLDRLWNVWLSQTGHVTPSFDDPCRSGSSVSSVTWGNMRFDEFVDATGAPINRTSREYMEDPILASVTYKPFGGAPVPFVAPAAPKERNPMPVAEMAAAVTADAPLELTLGQPITLQAPVAEQLRTRLSAIRDAVAEPASFVVEKVLPPQGFAAVRVRAFLNNPNATAETSYKDPSYIGYFAFFAGPHGHGHEADQGADYVLNLVPAIKRLGKKFDESQPLKITLVMVPKNEASAEALKRAKPRSKFASAKVVLGK
jgi:tyrosinase